MVKKPNVKKANTPIEKTKTETEIETKITENIDTEIPKKKKLKLDDNALLQIKSNIFGELIYINHKTGDEYKWSNFGEIRELYVSDLRAMKSNQSKFFSENWVVVVGIADTDEIYEDIGTDEIYDALQLTQYYKNFLCPEDLNEIFNWSVDDMKQKLPKMSRSIKETIGVRANELIQNGGLDSIAKVKALEEILGYSLISPEN
jgi:hypothetical protein